VTIGPEAQRAQLSPVFGAIAAAKDFRVTSLVEAPLRKFVGREQKVTTLSSCHQGLTDLLTEAQGKKQTSKS
jgi:hypothetical protein